MKKILVLLLSLIVCFSFVACGGGNEGNKESQPQSTGGSDSSVGGSDSSVGGSEEQSSDSQESKVTYTVTFSQEGQEDIVITVEEGKGIAESDLPTPVPEKGHTVMWDVEDFSVITGNLQVWAVAVANTYHIYYYISEEDVAEEDWYDYQEVVFGEAFSVMTLDEYENIELIGWKNAETGEMLTDGVYDLDEDISVILVANYLTDPY